MIFPEVDLDEWCEKYGLSKEEDICPDCGRILKPTIPFITKDFFGIKTDNSGETCGPDCGMAIAIARDPKDRKIWAEIADLCKTGGD